MYHVRHGVLNLLDSYDLRRSAFEMQFPVLSLIQYYLGVRKRLRLFLIQRDSKFRGFRLRKGTSSQCFPLSPFDGLTIMTLVYDL